MFATEAVTVIAHRGASAYAPEHTLAAYDRALQLGADALELDVRSTADGELVVIHDATLARTAGDPRAVADVTLRDLAALDPAVRPLTVDDVLRRYGTATRYVVELKDPRAPVERRLAESFARLGLRDRGEVQTFDVLGLRRARRADPATPLSQLYRRATPVEHILRDVRRVASFADAIGPCTRSVDAALVAAAHAHGLRVQPYTANEPAEIERLLALGVDALITDAPDRVRAAVDPLRAPVPAPAPLALAA